MFKDIRTIIPKAVKRNGLSKAVVETDVFSVFKKEIVKIVGEEEGEKTKAVFLKDQVLTVASLSNIVTEEIRKREPEMIDQINSNFDDRRVKSIKILT